ncbi:MAG: BTAD domain-containing putative transcriptional regulator [Brevundimonas sp.]
MQITTLGELAVDGRPVRGDRLAAVLRELVDARGRTVSVGSLAVAVWDGEPPADEAGAIQALVSRLRRTGLPVVGVAGGYRLPTEDIRVDASDARDLAAAAQAALRDGRTTDALHAADRARALFPDVPDLDDADVARLFSEVTRLRAQAALAGAGTLDDSDLQRLVHRTPPDEPALALLIRVLAAQGRDAEALDVVEQVRADLADRWGADLSPVVVEAHVALLRGELAPTPEVPRPRPEAQPRATTAIPASWRRAATPLLGRDEDVAAVLAAVREAPLVTLVATGGAGKTRLAAEVARAVAAQGHSVRVVELAGLRSSDEVLPAVLGAIGGMDTTPGRAELNAERRLLDPLERLRVAAADLDGLLVLDNCEHLLDAAALVVADLLDVASPDVVVLATSRAPLGLVGEAVHRLGALPDDDALNLLESRARAGRPDLAWDAGLALELCHRLDNLPLALELAAARLRSMPVEDVLDGLSDRFGLLDDALRGLPDRHASLWAMVDWSRELLSPAQRTLLQRLAVVAGSFSAEAAIAVAGDIPAADVRRGLAVLVDQSLLSLADQDQGPARYRMIETVREYGDARLESTGERPAAMAGLVTWARHRSEELAKDFIGPTQVVAFNATAADQEAMLVGARWSLALDDEPATIEILGALFWFWTVRGQHSEVVVWADRLLHSDDPAARRRSALINGARSGRPLATAEATVLVANFAALNSGVIESLRMAALALRAVNAVLAERADDVSPRNRVLAGTMPTLGSSDITNMLEPAGELLRSDDPFLAGIGFFLRAAIRENDGDSVASGIDAREAYRRFELAGDRWGMGMAAQGIGQWLGGREPGEAEQWLALGVRHLEEVGAFGDAKSIRVLLDVQRALQGDVEALARVQQASVSDQGDDGDAAQAHLGLALIAWSSGDVDRAARHADDAVVLVETRAVNPPQARVLFRVAAASIHLRAATTGKYAPERRAAVDARAVSLLRDARREAFSSSDMPVLGSFALGLAELAAFRERRDETAELYATGVRLGANLQLMFQLDENGLVAAIVGDAEARAARVTELRAVRPPDLTVRIGALTDDLLGA